ncbi:MFS transporter [Achromobacter spanius]|uniref:MFS transporter n=1 Tax=Achromobacter spanius TaxID=217203 RepID=UPI000F8F8F2A|nr:MFS transporter [Achromobacter spanius]AZS79930.1 MFS transporter [Achromobacter spanius]
MNAPLRNGLRQALFGWLNLALTAPGVYLWLGLPMVLRQHGWSGTAIGLFQLASLPTLFKFLLALPLERRRATPATTKAAPPAATVPAARAAYRGWAVLLLLIYAAVLCALGWRNLLDDKRVLFALATAAALAGTWADVPVNALAIRVLPPSSRAWAGGVRSMALCLGAIAGGGLMLVAQARWGWQAPFAIMAGALALGAASLLFVREDLIGGQTKSAPDRVHGNGNGGGNGDGNDNRNGNDGAIAHVWPQIRAYVKRDDTRRWLPLLALLFPFIGSGWFFLKPLLLDQGLPAERVGWLVGVAGGAVGAVASAWSARCSKRMRPAVTVPWHAAAVCAALLSLAAAVWWQAPPAVLIACAMGIAAAMGATAALTFSLMMSHARPGWQALDYGIQSSVFSLTRIAVPLAAGVLMDAAGQVVMLAALAAASACVVWMALRTAPSLRG